MEIYISETIAHKLKEAHNVKGHEVSECFANLKTKFAYDTREGHQTNPPTLWFIGETNRGRRLKIIFLRYNQTEIVLKSAYEPNADEERLYQMYQARG